MYINILQAIRNVGWDCVLNPASQRLALMFAIAGLAIVSLLMVKHA